VVAGVLVCSQVVLLATGLASGADLPLPPAPAPVAAYKAPVAVPFSRFYVGAAFNWTHHTGYVPNTTFSVERYTVGGKVFGGYRLNEVVQLEGAYHYLGRVPFYEGVLTNSHESSWAVSGSVFLVSPPISNWIGPTHVPIHAFVRFGLAYKDITHESVFGTFHEGILSGVFGAGWEYRLTPSVFARVEYEFLSTAIGGGSQNIPALNSLFQVNIGATNRVVNVMHTPLAVTLGMNF
jgi:outer membrane protein with beta-barrel domain